MELLNPLYNAENVGDEPLIFQDINKHNHNIINQNSLRSIDIDIYSENKSSIFGNSYDYYNNNHNNNMINTTTATTTTLASVFGDMNSTFYNTTTTLLQDMNSTAGTNTITMADLQQYLLFNIAYVINRYYLWVVFALGFPGNIVSFVTILHMKPFTSPTMYVAALALVDNTCLVCKMLFFLLTKHDVHLGDTGCGTLLFLGGLTAQLANWLLVAMTVERCLAICLPLKVGSICTRKIHVFGLVLVVLCLAGINAQNFVTNKMFDQNGDLSCNTNPSHRDFMKVWFWVDGIVYAILPSILLIVMNTILILGIRRSARVQRELTCKASQAAEGMRQQRQITIMLVIVCMTFVLLITPNAIFYAVQPNWDYKHSALETARYSFTQQLIFVLCDSTHAVNFYLYFFSTKRFRNRCLGTAFFCCFSKRASRTWRSGAGGRTTHGYRMSLTEVTAVPAAAGGGNGPMMPLRQFSSSSSSNSSASSMGRGGRHVILRNGGGGGDGGGRGAKVTRDFNGSSNSSGRHNDNNSKFRRYQLI